jgi:uncharacterized protein YqeY
MSLYQNIKTDRINAMKLKDGLRSKLLSTVLGEAEGKAKMKSNRASPEPDDMEMLAVIDATLKTAKENFEKYGVKDAELEIVILSGYKPEQMSGDDLELALMGITAEIDAGAKVMKNMGPILATMKSRYGGKYDAQKASAIVKALLS